MEEITKESEGYIQVVDLQKKKHPRIRLVNMYDQVDRNTNRRPARKQEVNWNAIIQETTIWAGDFNAHGMRWNDRLKPEERKDNGWVEHLMDTHDLTYIGDKAQTCNTPHASIHSVIELTMCTQEMATRSTAQTMLNPELATGSDHQIIEIEVEGPTQMGQDAIVRGWSIKEMTTKPTHPERGEETAEEKAGKE